MFLPKTAARTRKIGWLLSALVGITTLLYGYFNFFATPAFDEFIFYAAIAAVIPPATLNYVDYKWRRAIDEHLPDLFRSIVQAQETGMTLPQALEEASKREYGPLTAELRKMTTQMSWGMTFDEAIQTLARRVNTVLVQRTMPLVIEASRSGGHVERVFDPMGKFVQTTLLLDKERRTQTRPYIAIVYVAYFVFLFTIILLFKSFFASIEGLPLLGAAVMSPQQVRQNFFHMAFVQGFFGGLAAGKMGEGTAFAGLKHSLLMMVCGFVALKLFV